MYNIIVLNMALVYPLILKIESNLPTIALKIMFNLIKLD